jgi:hypothetical protein
LRHTCVEILPSLRRYAIRCNTRCRLEWRLSVSLALIMGTLPLVMTLLYSAACYDALVLCCLL